MRSTREIKDDIIKAENTKFDIMNSYTRELNYYDALLARLDKELNDARIIENDYCALDELYAFAGKELKEVVLVCINDKGETDVIYLKKDNKSTTLNVRNDNTLYYNNGEYTIKHSDYTYCQIYKKIDNNTNNVIEEFKVLGVLKLELLR